MRATPLLILLAACGTPEGDADEVDCATMATTPPSARGEWGAVYDAPRQRVVAFGGNEAVPVDCAPGANALLQDTWAFSPACGAWTPVATADATADAPRARSRYAVGHDAAGERLLLHGGRFRDGESGAYTVFDDTWALDLSTDTWTKVAKGGPGERSNHAGAVVGERFVIFGGNASDSGTAFVPLDDTWALDLATGHWSEVRADTAPPPRLFHAAATDGARLYVYGGGGEDALFGSFFQDLWALDVASGTWTELDDGHGKAPLGRINAHLVHDADRGRLLLFGGHDDGQLGNRNDVWAFDLGAGRWSKVRDGDAYANDPTGTCAFPADFTTIDPDSPERREAAAHAWVDGRWLVLGGKSDCGNLNDAWSFDPAADTWTEIYASRIGQSCLRVSAQCDSLCF
jgi:N-acetylneuraminic acid mutarotase